MEERLKSFKEKQVGLEHRRLAPHLPVQPVVWVDLHFPNTKTPGKCRTSPPFWKAEQAQQNQC